MVFVQVDWRAVVTVDLMVGLMVVELADGKVELKVYRTAQLKGSFLVGKMVGTKE